MGSTQSVTQTRFSSGRWAAEPSLDAPLQPADLDELPITRPSLGKRASRALARFLITCCIGVAATLAWQSYGDAARAMIVSSYPHLAWLAPAAPAVQTAPAKPATPSPDLDELKTISRGLAAVRQSVDLLAAGQQQMTREIAKLQTTRQDSPDRVSAPPPAPAAAPARKPVPLPSQAQPVR